MKDESLALELLKDSSKRNKRTFTVLLVVIFLWFATIGYLVYILNNIDMSSNPSTTSILTN